MKPPYLLLFLCESFSSCEEDIFRKLIKVNKITDCLIENRLLIQNYIKNVRFNKYVSSFGIFITINIIKPKQLVRSLKHKKYKYD